MAVDKMLSNWKKAATNFLNGQRSADVGAAGATFEDVAAAVQNGTAHIIDVREPSEFAAGHIAGSVNMPLSSFDPAALPLGKPVILICHSGTRSGRAKSVCEQARRPDIVQFSPGIAGWRANGGALVR